MQPLQRRSFLLGLRVHHDDPDASPAPASGEGIMGAAGEQANESLSELAAGPEEHVRDLFLRGIHALHTEKRLVPAQFGPPGRLEAQGLHGILQQRLPGQALVVVEEVHSPDLERILPMNQVAQREAGHLHRNPGGLPAAHPQGA